MTLVLVQFGVAAVVIIVAGTFLSKFADEIAERTGFGRLLVGSVLLAGATSLPELTVDISAVRNGMADLAFGDLLGSSLFNLLILAILDLSSQSRGRMLSRVAARHALSGNVSAALTAMVSLCLLTRPLSAGGEILGVSYGLWFVAVGYVLAVRMVYFDQQSISATAAAEPTTDPHTQGQSLTAPIAGFLAAALVIVIAGPFLSDSAGKIADLTGLGKSFVGATLVAFSTSLPELVTSLAALRMGAHDLAIGNIFGSNAFNMILFVPLDWFQEGPILNVVAPEHAIVGLAVIIASLVTVLGQLYQIERRRWLIDPDATVVILIIVGALWMIYRLS